MRYYLIVGEARGDLHAAHLMRELAKADREAEFRFFGGDKMAAEGGTLVRHYREMAYMGFVPVLLHLPAIFRNMAQCKEDIRQCAPAAVLLVDYPSFNLDIAKVMHKNGLAKVFYYISPKIWAWKEYRIKNIKRDVDHLLSILPFEVSFFEQKHHYPIHYVGNPTADEVMAFLDGDDETAEAFAQRHNLVGRPIVSLVACSRRQEVKDSLPAMLQVVDRFPKYQFVLACAPSIERSYYEGIEGIGKVSLVEGETFAVLAQATAALVTSGTATLETALFGVPQVVCYKTPVPRLIRFAFNHIIQCKYISLVNLIADREVVTELVADTFKVSNIVDELTAILPGGRGREEMLKGYEEVRRAIGKPGAPANAAQVIVDAMRNA